MFYSFNKYLLFTCYMPGAFLGLGWGWTRQVVVPAFLDSSYSNPYSACEGGEQIAVLETNGWVASVGRLGRPLEGSDAWPAPDLEGTRWARGIRIAADESSVPLGGWFLGTDALCRMSCANPDLKTGTVCMTLKGPYVVVDCLVSFSLTSLLPETLMCTFLMCARSVPLPCTCPPILLLASRLPAPCCPSCD